MSALRPRSAAAMARPFAEVRRRSERASWLRLLGGLAVLLLWAFFWCIELPLILGGGK